MTGLSSHRKIDYYIIFFDEMELSHIRNFSTTPTKRSKKTKQSTRPFSFKPRPNIQTYKVCLIGDPQIGKSKFCCSLLGYNVKSYRVPIGPQVDDEDEQSYQSTLSIEVYPWITPYSTSIGSSIRYNIWDMAGEDRHKELKVRYYLGCDHVFIMWDGNNYPNKWISECMERHIPYTLVLNTDQMLPDISR